MSYQHVAAGFARLAILVGMSLATGLTACTLQQSPSATSLPTDAPGATSSPPATVRSGSSHGALGQAGQYLAHAQGYFEREGLDVQFVETTPDAALTALIAGDLDVSGLGLDPGLFSAIQRGVEFRIVATQASSEPNANGAFIVLRKDLADSGKVKTYADLKGRTVAVPNLDGSLNYVLAKALEAGGLTLGDADVVVLNFPDMVTALGTGAIDVGFLPEPLASVAVRNGAGVKWRGVADVVPGFQQSVVVFSPQFAARRDVATRWMTGYIRGIRDYNDAFTRNLHRPQTIDSLATALGIQPALFEAMGFMDIDPDGRVNTASVRDLMDWYVQMGYLSQPIDLAGVIDPSFAQAAVARLGEYQ